MTELKDLRKKIDSIDDELVKLFVQRMDVSDEVARVKAASDIPLNHPGREKEILLNLCSKVPEKYHEYVTLLFGSIFNISKAHQILRMNNSDTVSASVKAAMEKTDNIMPKNATVACQGTEGSFSQSAAEKLFRRPEIMYFNSFEGVFNAVEKGLCRYGVLPIENSSYGSVTAVYDLMRNFSFHITKTLKLHVSHSLLAKPGSRLEDIKEIFSHPQALGQCSEFLKALPNVKITDYENTAAAARMIAESDRKDVAAISSEDCMRIYGLEPLKTNIQNNENNYTRFICISKDMEVYPGSDKFSLILSLPHIPSALYNILSRFAALGINITKLESRPIPGSDFNFMFYFDFEGSVYSDEILHMLDGLADECEEFHFLGCYSESC